MSGLPFIRELGSIAFSGSPLIREMEGCAFGARRLRTRRRENAAALVALAPGVRSRDVSRERPRPLPTRHQRLLQAPERTVHCTRERALFETPREAIRVVTGRTVLRGGG